MTDLRCVVCGAAEDTAFLCVRCTDALEQNLAELPSLFAELTVTETRQGRTYRAAGRQAAAEPPYDPEADVEPRLRSKDGRIALRGFALPYDEAASVLRDEAMQTCQTWGRHLAESRGATGPTVANLFVWLVAHVDAVRMDEAAAEMVDEIADVHRRLTRAVDRSPDRTFWGRCDAPVGDEDDEKCERDLYAREDASTIVCDGHRGDEIGCGATKHIDDVRATIRSLTEGALVTIAEVLYGAKHLFPNKEQMPPRRIMDGWVKAEKPRIKPHGKNRAGELLFSGRELLALVDAYKPQKPRRGKCAA